MFFTNNVKRVGTDNYREYVWEVKSGENVEIKKGWVNAQNYDRAQIRTNVENINTTTGKVVGGAVGLAVGTAVVAAATTVTLPVLLLGAAIVVAGIGIGYGIAKLGNYFGWW